MPAHNMWYKKLPTLALSENGDRDNRKLLRNRQLTIPPPLAQPYEKPYKLQ